jgi:hypothetical protein
MITQPLSIVGEVIEEGCNCTSIPRLKKTAMLHNLSSVNTRCVTVTIISIPMQK